jgi:hypothetical protein
MKKEVIFIIRLVILNFLFMVGIIGIFSTPSDDLGILAWIGVLIISKAIGILAFALMFSMGDTWFGRFFENKAL